MCPNIVIQKDTALSENCIRSSLVQEGVRRLLNCSVDLPVIEKQEILSKFASKMLNSKHSVESVKFILVHAVTRYNELIRKSKLNPEDPNFKPLHFDQILKLTKENSQNLWHSRTGTQNLILNPPKTGDQIYLLNGGGKSQNKLKCLGLSILQFFSALAQKMVDF